MAKKINLMHNSSNNTIPKNRILNWLYSTDRHVSLEKLGAWLENKTNGQYGLIRAAGNNRSAAPDSHTSPIANKDHPLEKNFHE